MSFDIDGESEDPLILTSRLCEICALDLTVRMKQTWDNWVHDKYAERDRREYYQNIVYEICNMLDGLQKERIVCGNVNEPTREVQEAVERLCEKAKGA